MTDINIEDLWRQKLAAGCISEAPAEAPKPGVIKLDCFGKERFARLIWRDVIVYERMPLQFWKMKDSAKEMEVRRITMELIKKMKRVYGSAPAEIVGEGE